MGGAQPARGEENWRRGNRNKGMGMVVVGRAAGSVILNQGLLNQWHTFCSVSQGGKQDANCSSCFLPHKVPFPPFKDRFRKKSNRTSLLIEKRLIIGKSYFNLKSSISNDLKTRGGLGRQKA